MTVEVLSPHPAGNYRALVSEETDDLGDADPAGPRRARQHRSRARAARREHRQRELAAGYAAATGLLISRPLHATGTQSCRWPAQRYVNCARERPL